MTESGQVPETPPDPQQTPTPDWAPNPAAEASGETPPPLDPTAPPPVHPASAPSAPTGSTEPAEPAELAATMRLIPARPAAPASAPADVAPTMRMVPTHPAATTTPPMVNIPLVAGGRQIGKYVIKRELGRGGMGAVYLAEQTGLGREVAIKELIASASADPVALQRFMQEARVMARTSHPNLVQVHDLEQIGSANYIVLEFVRGKSLRDLIDEGPIPLPQTFAVMHGVLQALEYAHNHAIVHRDMKPENVLLSDEGAVKVADFGIARLTDDSDAGPNATKTGTTVGTPQYMSPEQVASSKVDGRSDLYSAGIVFYELVVGKPPFTTSEADGPFTIMAKHVQAPPKPPSVHVPGLDRHLEEIILKSLSKRPEDRYQSGQEFDAAMCTVADRLCPGWLGSLNPGADLTKMVPGTAVAAATAGAAVSAMPAVQPLLAGPLQVPYNPAPPVKPVQKSAGCMGVLVGALGLAPIVWVLVAITLH